MQVDSFLINFFLEKGGVDLDQRAVIGIYLLVDSRKSNDLFTNSSD